MKFFSKILVAFVLILSILLSSVSCTDTEGTPSSGETNSTGSDAPQFYIVGDNRYILSPGETLTLYVEIPDGVDGEVEWKSSHSCVSVENGTVTVHSYGTSVVKATIGEYSDSVIILVPGVSSDNSSTDSGKVDSSGNEDKENGSDDNVGNSTNDSSNSTTDSTDGSVDNTEDSDNNNAGDGFASEYDTISVIEALEIAEQYKSASSYEKYYIVATISEMISATDGRMNIYDSTGTIYVYKSAMLDGESITDSSLSVGDVVLICGTLRNYKGTLEIEKGTIVDYYSPNKPSHKNDPYVNVDVEEFYANYKPATSYEDAYYRTLHNLMSGTLSKQDQTPTLSPYQPMQDGMLVRNTEMIYSEDGNVYYVLDAYGDVAMEIYKGAGYVTLEEVAAHVFAFGEPPANQTSSKNTKPTSSEWGIYLRLNHTSFSGSTSKYPYEPELPNISGCGGTLEYYEMDIGTTGTDCDPSYAALEYNDGISIIRGAARLVYACEDDDKNGTIDYDERYVFYTYNHYNDFQEYLNYEGGWGEMFGNITGGGKISSKTDYNPTPYIPTAYAPLTSKTLVTMIVYLCEPVKLWFSEV